MVQVWVLSGLLGEGQYFRMPRVATGAERADAACLTSFRPQPRTFMLFCLWSFAHFCPLPLLELASKAEQPPY
jgi:hypothetical protein